VIPEKQNRLHPIILVSHISKHLYNVFLTSIRLLSGIFFWIFCIQRVQSGFYISLDPRYGSRWWCICYSATYNGYTELFQDRRS
jgi:hypothetical protein